MADFVLTYPVSQIMLDPIFNEAPFQSESGLIQTRAKMGNRWRCGLLWQNAHNNGANLREIRGLILALRGRLNRLRVNPVTMCGWEQGGNLGGTTTLSAAVLPGESTLSLQGATPNISNYLRPGDLLSIGLELKMVAGTSQVSSDAGGAVSVSVWPELHRNYAIGQQVVLDDPVGVFKMTGVSPFDSGVPSFEHHDSIALDLEEAVEA